MESIFLSASIPKPGRPGYGTADPLLIHSAIRSFLTLALGRRHIVWGGHPSITPMVVAACENFGLEYFDCVSLYQSRFYEKNFPPDNDQFDNLTLISAGADEADSLKRLRHAMFADNQFISAVFIGGMEGVEDEFNLLQAKQPQTKLLPVFSPGGMAAELAVHNGYKPDADEFSTDFTGLFISQLDIDPSEPRVKKTPQKGMKP